MLDTAPQPERQKARNEMVDCQIAARGIADTYVLEAMRAVPREFFVPSDVDGFAYEDMPLPIGQGQTISQPYIVALMAEMAEMHPTDKVLEIGTGSGYGAAVLSRIADEVFTIERNESLSMRADNILTDLGFDNVTVLHRDGSNGLPEEAPFDAIVVTAGAPEIPRNLLEQLKPGGRLVIPVGTDDRRQHLFQVYRRGDGTFETEDYGPVAFVPLIGEHGWSESEAGRPSKKSNVAGPAALRADIDNLHHDVNLLRRAAAPLPMPESPHFGQFFDHLGDAKIVLLGESTHGTAEFYRARAAITQRLIRNHGFNIVALEADWPDAAVLDGYVRNRKVPDIGQPAFSRFPQWMWRNQEFRQLVSWMRKHNDRQKDDWKAGIYGLDLYSLGASIEAIISFLEQRDPEAAEAARERYSCFEPWLDDPVDYGRTTLSQVSMQCDQEAVAMLMDLMGRRQKLLAQSDDDDTLDVIRNAKLVAAAEKYYRSMFFGQRESWNLRDRHMFGTLREILETKGPNAKAIVWAHNSHVGDARATDMGTTRREINLGQLCRENFGDEARLVGFGTASGTVAAAHNWGGPPTIMDLRPPIAGSFEDSWVKTDMRSALLDINNGGIDGELRRELDDKRLERAIGVIYRPDSERMSHYRNARPGKQFDHYVWFRDTRAVTPIITVEEQGSAELYPFGE